ncbi:DUF805 domain-containing protein [Leisingera thetidis]|uniref:DUF805 domain-containing protein n=1 Tax=Leisingera thetidis TaxID=2930199 RepID=UPI0021F75C60|nr:DUF805 domain-containing protein [Leisingera thetidis]
MGFGEAVRTVFKKKYATFSGRASRSEYWFSFLFVMLVECVLFGVVVAFGAMAYTTTGELSGAAAGAVGVLIVFFLAAIIPMISVTIRRLHDRNMSGWWYLGFVVVGMVPYVGIIVSIAFLVIFALKGTDGDNRFGPDPLRGSASAEVFA